MDWLNQIGAHSDFWSADRLWKLAALWGSWWEWKKPTLILNAGQQFQGDFPAHITLDTEAREAIWRYPGTREILHLDHPLSKTPIQYL